MPRTYDLLVFGATGFTGGLVVDYMAQNYAGKGIKWAIAGRSRFACPARTLRPPRRRRVRFAQR